jgi:hypothetical protein
VINIEFCKSRFSKFKGDNGYSNDLKTGEELERISEES